MLERAGVNTGLELSALISANHWLAEVMGRTLPAMVAKAPAFPKQLQEG
jgi:hydroxymethylglutaryl-CoA lyase